MGVFGISVRGGVEPATLDQSTVRDVQGIINDAMSSLQAAEDALASRC